MLELMTFLKGLLLGFSVAAPVGPIGLLCVRRSLQDGAAHGFATGLGAAIADTIYGLIAALGLTFISSLLIENAESIRIFGGLLLFFFGLKIFFTKPIAQNIEFKRKSIKGAFLSSFLLTATNPLTILFFTVAMTSLGLGSTAKSGHLAFALVFGVFLGSALWWAFLSLLAARLQTKMNTKSMTWLNRISGLILILFSAFALF